MRSIDDLLTVIYAHSGKVLLGSLAIQVLYVSQAYVIYVVALLPGGEILSYLIMTALGTLSGIAFVAINTVVICYAVRYALERKNSEKDEK